MAEFSDYCQITFRTGTTTPIRKLNRYPVGSNCPVIDSDVPAAARDQLGPLDSCEDRHRVLLQVLVACGRPGLREDLGEPTDVHSGEFVDLGSDLRRKIIKFRAHDAAQAHAIVVGQSRDVARSSAR